MFAVQDCWIFRTCPEVSNFTVLRLGRWPFGESVQRPLTIGQQLVYLQKRAIHWKKMQQKASQTKGPFLSLQGTRHSSFSVYGHTWCLGRWEDAGVSLVVPPKKPGHWIGCFRYLSSFSDWFTTKIPPKYQLELVTQACMLTDPGACPMDMEYAEGERHCTKCRAPKPLRAHHCSLDDLIGLSMN